MPDSTGSITPWHENRVVINKDGSYRAIVDANDSLLRTNVLYIGTPFASPGSGEVLQTGGVLSAYRVPTPSEDYDAGQDHWIGWTESGKYTITGGRLFMGGNSVHIGENAGGHGVFVHVGGQVYTVGDVDRDGVWDEGVEDDWERLNVGLDDGVGEYHLGDGSSALPTCDGGYLDIGTRGTGTFRMKNGRLTLHGTIGIDLGKGPNGNGTFLQSGGEVIVHGMSPLSIVEGSLRVTSGVFTLVDTVITASAALGELRIEAFGKPYVEVTMEDIDPTSSQLFAPHVTVAFATVQYGKDVQPKTALLQIPTGLLLNRLSIGSARTIDEGDDGNLNLDLLSDVVTNHLEIKAGLNYSQHAGNYRIHFDVDTQPKILKPGDANLDGKVDISDYNIWNQNSFTFGTDWSMGDFNGDRITDTSDFNIWNSYQGT